MPGYRTDDQPVENQEEHAAQAEQQTGGECLEGDADVMHHVIAEHHPVFTRCAFGGASQAAGVGVVHGLHLGHLLGAYDAVDQFGKKVDQQRNAQQAAEEQQAGDRCEPPLLPHQAWKTGQDETQYVRRQLAAMAIKLLVAAQGQLLQWVYQVTAVAAFLCQRQMLAKTPVLMGEVSNIIGLGRALFQLPELFGEGLPFGLVTAFELALLHVGPSRPRARPLSC